MTIAIPVATLARQWQQRRGKSLVNQLTGNLRQLADGRAGIVVGLNAANLVAGTLLQQEPAGIVNVAKAAVATLDGGNAYVNLANQNVNYKALNNQDFLIGTFVGDQAAGDPTCNVLLGSDGRPVLDLARDPFTTALVLTAGAPSITRYGGANQLALDATNEAQKVDALSDAGFGFDGLNTGGIFEAEINVVSDDSSTHGVFSIGLASGTHATAFSSIAHAIGFQLKAHDTHIYAICNDTPVVQTDTTVTYTAGTPFQVWIDMRVPGAPKLYVNGIQVLASTSFAVTYVSPWYLLAHLVKTATTDTFTVKVNYARLRGLSI